MFHKSATQPYCRTCGQPIKKRTTDIYFGRDMTKDYNNPATCRAEEPRTKAEAQRLVNQQIISVKRWGGETIQSVAVWDGETYWDELFCKVVCAEAFGRMCAKLYPDLETQRAADARRLRERQTHD